MSNLSAIASAVERATGRAKFADRGHTPKDCAQANLSGLTHYVEDGTMRYFHSRITSCRAECEGLVLVIIESVAADFRNTRRGFRFVAFDLFGEVLDGRRSVDDLRRTSAQASKDAAAWLAGFDVAAHYKAALNTEAERAQRRADAFRAAAAEI